MRFVSRLAMALGAAAAAACSGSSSPPAANISIDYPSLQGRYAGTVWDRNGDAHEAWLRIDPPNESDPSFCTAGFAAVLPSADLSSQFGYEYLMGVAIGGGGRVTVADGLATFVGQEFVMQWRLEGGLLAKVSASTQSVAPGFLFSAFSPAIDTAHIEALLEIDGELHFVRRDLVAPWR